MNRVLATVIHCYTRIFRKSYTSYIIWNITPSSYAFAYKFTLFFSIYQRISSFINNLNDFLLILQKLCKLFIPWHCVKHGPIKNDFPLSLTICFSPIPKFHTQAETSSSSLCIPMQAEVEDSRQTNSNVLSLVS